MPPKQARNGTGRVSRPSPDKRCRLNRSMQHLVTTCSDNTSFRESTSTAVLNQNLNRAFVLFELTPGNEIGLPGSYKKTLSKCCNDPLRPPDFSGLGIDFTRVGDNRLVRHGGPLYGA